MDTFLKNMEITALTAGDREGMEAPITLEELQQAVAEMANQKSPEPDGLLVDTYKHYGKVLFPELLKVLNWTVVEGKLPNSMTEVTIVLLYKEGKDPLDTSSYRPISLLCSDAKILARVLAARLNKIIDKPIHPDQTDTTCYAPGCN